MVGERDAEAEGLDVRRTVECRLAGFIRGTAMLIYVLKASIIMQPAHVPLQHL